MKSNSIVKTIQYQFHNTNQSCQFKSIFHINFIMLAYRNTFNQILRIRCLILQQRKKIESDIGWIGVVGCALSNFLYIFQ